MIKIMTMKKYLILALCLAPLQLSAFTIHKWVDNEGRTIYGDKPPKEQRSTPVDLPEITVIKSLPVEKQAYQTPPSSTENADGLPTSESNASSQTASAYEKQPSTEPRQETETEENITKTVTLTYPKNGQVLKTQEGEVTIMFVVKPALKKGESLVIYLDGKQKEAGQQTAFTFEQLEQGTHSVLGVLQNKAGNVIANSESVKFHIANVKP
jgi:hypothetical protein